MREVDWNTVCTFCGAEHRIAACFGDRTAPKDDDLSLCMICGEWNMFSMGAPGKLRKPTDAEYQLIGASERARAARQAWINIQKGRNE
jgi:hypothetical protein